MEFKNLREKYKGKFPSSLVAAAVKIALDMGGAMTPAVKKIEAMKRGLSNDPAVKKALQLANEDVNEITEEKFKLVDMDDKTAMNAQKLAKKAGLKGVVKKGSTGSDVMVVGDNKKMAKFLMSLPNEGVEVDEADLSEISPEMLDRYMTKAAASKRDLKSKRGALKKLGDKEMAKKMDAKLKRREKGFRGAVIRHSGKTQGDIYLDPKSPVAKAIAKMPKNLLKKYGLELANVEPHGTQLNEFKTSFPFFDLKSATAAEKLAMKMGIHSKSEKKGKLYTVHVDGKFTTIEKWVNAL